MSEKVSARDPYDCAVASIYAIVIVASNCAPSTRIGVVTRSE